MQSDALCKGRLISGSKWQLPLCMICMQLLECLKEAVFILSLVFLVRRLCFFVQMDHQMGIITSFDMMIVDRTSTMTNSIRHSHAETNSERALPLGTLMKITKIETDPYAIAQGLGRKNQGDAIRLALGHWP